MREVLERAGLAMGGGAVLGAGLLLLLPGLTGGPSLVPGSGAETSLSSSDASTCAAVPDTGEVARTSAPPFYAIDLVPTGNVPGTARVTGSAAVTFVDSPFDVAVADDGTFHHRVRVDLRPLSAPESRAYVVWAAPPNLDPIRKLGTLGPDMTLKADVAFPKFLLVVTLEDDPDGITGRWSGPIAFRGMSRSGLMHTMAGHGPFQGEPCASYGFSRPPTGP